MTTPTSPPPARPPLRLHLAERPGQDVLDGGWWPRSRALAVELADLVDHLSADRRRIVQARCSPSDWTDPPSRVAVDGGWVTTGTLPQDETHLVVLSSAGPDPDELRLLVVPPELTEDQGQEALLAAASRGNAHPAAELLRTVTEHPDVDPRDHW